MLFARECLGKYCQYLHNGEPLLKLLAKELDIPVLVLSQLSRACEKRNDRRPMLADLRDSGAIEQDADVVLFLYRHEVYVPDTEEKGVAEVLVRKHRNGPIGDRRLRFVEEFARFEDLP
jgi:replicative DNA helicase